MSVVLYEVEDRLVALQTMTAGKQRAWVWTGKGGTLDWRQAPGLAGKARVDGYALTLAEFAAQFPGVPLPVFPDTEELQPAPPPFALPVGPVIDVSGPSQDGVAGPLGHGDLHYTQSVLRERIVEHLFVGEALRLLWRRGITDVEVLRSEFDAGGYDLVMSRGKVVRHIQFKTMTVGGKAAGVSIGLKLAEKPSGCVVWTLVTPGLDLQSFRWFGGAPGEALPTIAGMKTTKQTKGNAQGVKLERPHHRVVPVRAFTPLPTLEKVLEALFGDLG